MENQAKKTERPWGILAGNYAQSLYHLPSFRSPKKQLVDLLPRLILPQGCWGEKTQTLGHIQLFLHVHDFSTNKGKCTVFLRRDAFMSCILSLTDGHLPLKASKVRSNNQTRGPWSFQSLGHQPKFHKATESVQIKMRKAATLVLKEHTQLKVAFGERLICKEFPEKERC